MPTVSENVRSSGGSEVQRAVRTMRLVQFGQGSSALVIGYAISHSRPGRKVLGSLNRKNRVSDICSDASSSRSSAARWHGRLPRVHNSPRCLSLVCYPSVHSSRILRQRLREVSRREVTWSEKTSG